VAAALFSQNCSRGDYLYESKTSYKRFMKKQREAKQLKINELERCESGVGRKKMLKMQDDPTMCMKTQGRATECRSRNHALLIEIGRFWRR
jgi:hypothetical protein